MCKVTFTGHNVTEESARNSTAHVSLSRGHFTNEAAWPST
jgi:hypothetical protein